MRHAGRVGGGGRGRVSWGERAHQKSPAAKDRQIVDDGFLDLLDVERLRTCTQGGEVFVRPFSSPVFLLQGRTDGVECKLSGAQNKERNVTLRSCRGRTEQTGGRAIPPSLSQRAAAEQGAGRPTRGGVGLGTHPPAPSTIWRTLLERWRPGGRQNDGTGPPWGCKYGVSARDRPPPRLAECEPPPRSRVTFFFNQICVTLRTGMPAEHGGRPTTRAERTRHTHTQSPGLAESSLLW